jgi:hypothetical protein
MGNVNRTVEAGAAELRAARTAEQAEQLLRCLGGDSITLRISIGLLEADARGLGMTAMGYEDVEIRPAMMITRSDGTRVLQVSAVTVRRVAEARGASARDLLAAVMAVVVNRDELFPLKKVEPQYIGTIEYIYNLVLSE